MDTQDPTLAMPSVPVYTIGYGSRSMDEFIATLRAHQITYLIDVRSAPYSRYRPEFSKTELENQLRLHEIRYVYLGDRLGGRPTDRSCYVDDKVVYELVRQKPFFLDGLRRIRRAFEQQLHIVLMCSEGKPEACHRTKLIGAALTELGVLVMHIDEEGALRTQDEVTAEITNGQLLLFEDINPFTSRKRYRAKDEGADAAAHFDDEDSFEGDDE
jgi:uncharacterized protein (DUF488 family)